VLGDAVSLLERGLRRVTDAFRYALIAYISGSDVPMDAIYQYVGNGPVVHGAKGLSITQRIDVDSLRQHFLTDIALARTCFDFDKLREGVIRLRSECAEAFKNSPTLSSVARFALFLENLRGKERAVAKLRSDVAGLGLSASVDELIAYLALLFPAKVRVCCGNTDVYDYLVHNFDKLKSVSSRSDAAKVFLVAVSELCKSIDDAVVEVMSMLRFLNVAGTRWSINIFETAINALKSAGVTDAEDFLLKVLGASIQSPSMNATLSMLAQHNDARRAIQNLLDSLKPTIEAYRGVLVSCAEKLKSLSLGDTNAVLGSLLTLLITSDQRFVEVSKAFPLGLMSRAKDVVRDNAYVLLLCRMFGTALK
jgi:hypothetical protein